MAKSKLKDTLKEYKKHAKGKKADVHVVSHRDLLLPDEMDKRDVKNVRQVLELSQSKFAKVLGVDTVTVQKWENGTRNPAGPARRLMQVLFTHPELTDHILKSSQVKISSKKKLIQS